MGKWYSAASGPSTVMESYKVEIMPQATDDLENIYDYISRKLKAPVAAQRLMLNIEKAILGLKDMAPVYPKCQDETLSKKGYRKLIIKNYIAFYIVDEEKKTAVVTRVLYGRRLVEALL
ncbi:translation repressor RelE [Spirochaetia bacterium]|nr:translation repressor RelE [Spirochaetia bacterium]